MMDINYMKKNNIIIHVLVMLKVRKSVERRAKPVVRPRKFATHKDTWDLIN